jgi:hypothetical protein
LRSELQPFMIGAIFLAEEGVQVGPDNFVLMIGTAVTSGIKSLAAMTVPIAAAAALFRQQLAEALKGNSVSSDIGSRVLAVAAKVAIWFAGAALPLLIWVGYLHLSYWGIENDEISRCAQQSSCIAESNRNTSAASKDLAGEINFDTKTGAFSAEIASKAGVAPRGIEWVTTMSDAPLWLVSSAKRFGNLAWWPGSGREYIGLSIAALYASVALLLFALSWFLGPNTNSLHRLYRDRLSKAFLFDPKPPADGKPARNEPSIDQGRDFPDLDDPEGSGDGPAQIGGALSPHQCRA